MADKQVLLTATKAFELGSNPEAAWTILGGAGSDSQHAAAYFHAVPWLYRAVEIRAEAVASMPFAIYRGNGQAEYDTSVDYKNKVGFFPGPRALLWLVEACLTLEPQAYLFSDNVGSARKKLRYILPNGVTPHIDPVAGLQYFIRQVAGQQRQYKPGVDVVYFWRSDPYTEQGAGPGASSPGRAALLSAGVLANIDEFITGYFAHGAVKATILGVRGNPSKDERDKLERWWSSFVSGVKNAWGAKVVNADAITPTVIGEGLEALGNNAVLTQERRENIATALGVPHSLLFSNAANFATAQQDDLHFYSKTIVPECEFIAEVLNEQVFGPAGYRFVFQPETLDAFQEDTQQQAAALSQLTGAGVPLLMAMDLVGIELNKAQRAELEKALLDKEQRAEEMAQQLQPGQADQPPAQDEEQETPAQADARKWRAKAVKAVKRGEAASVPFESDAIPEAEQVRIRAGLEDCQTVEDVRAVFETRAAADPLALLAVELKRANDLLAAEYERAQ